MYDFYKRTKVEPEEVINAAISARNAAVTLRRKMLIGDEKQSIKDGLTIENMDLIETICNRMELMAREEILWRNVEKKCGMFIEEES